MEKAQEYAKTHDIVLVTPYINAAAIVAELDTKKLKLGKKKCNLEDFRDDLSEETNEIVDNFHFKAGREVKGGKKGKKGKGKGSKSDKEDKESSRKSKGKGKKTRDSDASEKSEKGKGINLLVSKIKEIIRELLSFTIFSRKYFWQFSKKNFR